MSEGTAGRLIVVGAGGHAKVVIELLRAMGERFEILGLVDQDATPRQVLDLPVLGDDQALAALRDQGADLAFIAVGNNALRQQLGDTVRALGYRLVNAISPAASVSPSAVLGQGIAIMAGAVVNAEAVIGDMAILNTGALIDHDVRLGLASHVAPGCALAGNVTVGDRAFLGVGVNVIPEITIGADSVVGAGSSVIEDLPEGVLAVGTPARIVRSLGERAPA